MTGISDRLNRTEANDNSVYKKTKEDASGKKGGILYRGQILKEHFHKHNLCIQIALLTLFTF